MFYAKLKGALTGFIVAMVTCYVEMMIIKCSIIFKHLSVITFYHQLIDHG